MKIEIIENEYDIMDDKEIVWDDSIVKLKTDIDSDVFMRITIADKRCKRYYSEATATSRLLCDSDALRTRIETFVYYTINKRDSELVTQIVVEATNMYRRLIVMEEGI